MEMSQTTRRVWNWAMPTISFVGLLLIVLYLAACSSGSETTTTEAPAAVPASCEPTRSDALGPFYVPNAPVRSSVGQGHVLTGIVRSSLDCSRIPGAQIEFWQVGPDGQYDDDHRATMQSDASGAYRFESNVPPPYSGRPPHIHIRVTAPGSQTLVTQYYPGDGETSGAFDLVLIPGN